MKQIKGILMVVLFGASLICSAHAEGSTNTLPFRTCNVLIQKC